jgi:hypothetical protein
MEELLRHVELLVHQGPPAGSSRERKEAIDRAHAAGRAPAMRWRSGS